MSRSYKKTTICKDKNSKFGKRKANHAVRRNMDIKSGGSYKKAFCSWDICEYKFIQTENDFRTAYESGNSHWSKRYATYEEALLAWKKAYKFK